MCLLRRTPIYPQEPATEWPPFAGPLNNLHVLNNFEVRSLDLSSCTVSLVAGSVAGYAGDGGPALKASLHQPASVVYDAEGNLYIADAANNRVRCIGAKTKIIRTVAGNGMPFRPHPDEVIPER